MFLIINRARFKRVVVEQDLYTIGPGLLEPAHRPEIEQSGQAARLRGVITGLFIGQQKTGTLSAMLCSG
jgi:hypothetical protein